MLVEISGRRRVFVPISRVTSIAPGQVITNGLIDLRRFSQRGQELRVIAELLGRKVTLQDGSGSAAIEDVAIEKNKRLLDIEHAKAANVPIVVAINKVDLPGSNPSQIRQRLMEQLELEKEDNWFFRLSAFTDALIAHYEAHPEAIQPRSAYNEVMSFIRQGLKDAGYLVSVRKHFESFESFVIQSGDLIREGHHRCGRRRTADVTTAANCDIRVT